jgi:hypothetical protein
MKLPPLHGSCSHRDFFIYAACDSEYFDAFGKTFVQSTAANSDHLMHVHLYNPRLDQIAYCDGVKNLTYTYEYVTADLFTAAVQNLESTSNTVHLERSLTAMRKSNDANLAVRIQKTYYACARFVRLWEMIAPDAQVLAVDSDAVIRSKVPALTGQDFYIHYITGNKARYLAGGVMLSGRPAGYQFISEYAQELLKHINCDCLYWSLDQDVLDPIVPRYSWGNLPKSYIDWDMHPDSYIWTAKGQRKDRPTFINEQRKYNS